jgi:hypothetical protein
MSTETMYLKDNAERNHRMKKHSRVHCGILISIALVLGAPMLAIGQQRSEPQQKESASSNEAALKPAPASNEGELTEREKRLLDRIDNLERRLAELESRTKAAGAATEAPSATTATFKAPADRAHPNPTNSSPGLATASPSGSGAAGEAKAGAKDVASTEVGANTQAQSEPSAAQPQAPRKKEPFAFGDFTWLTGNSRQKDYPLDSKVFTGELRVDTAYHYSFTNPIDHTITGSTEVFRSNEVQLTHFAVGGDFHWNNVRGRLLTQFGMYSQTQPRNDASPGLGQYNLDNAYRYISEAYGGYHIDKLNGINIDAGIFLSYVGLFSFYQFDNWSYQPSYVSSNTPWYFNGLRIQIFTSDKLKIEPWIINGWQSYGKFNKAPGLGMQVLWRPTSSLSLLSNNYWGTDTLGIPGRKRVHTDNSIQFKYLDRPTNALSKGAFTFTLDAGCEYGTNSGVSCAGAPGRPAQYFLGFMAYNRLWFHHDLFGLTLGGGAITNPGRYLVILPPINGATAFTGSPYFTANPGDKFKAWDASVTFDYMPTQFSTFRFEVNHRAANVPYFEGPNGITPPGGNNGNPGALIPGFTPDLRKYENRITLALLVKF